MQVQAIKLGLMTARVTTVQVIQVAAGGGAGGAGQLNASAVLLSTNANVPAGYYSTSPTGV